MMTWFAAKLVFRNTVGDGFHTPQFDEQLRLIQAETANEAMAKANKIALAESTVFSNHQKENVSWSFVAISQLIELDALYDGMEIDSRTIESNKPEQLICDAKQRQELLECLHLTSINTAVFC